MTIRFDPNPHAWRSAPPLDPTHRDRKRHMTREDVARLLWFAAGVVVAAVVGVWS